MQLIALFVLLLPTSAALRAPLMGVRTPAPRMGVGTPRRVLAELPFAEARAMGMGSKDEWDEYSCPGAYRLPKDPDVVWEAEWRGWDDWLGTRRPYDDGRRLARTLGIHSELRWYDFAYRHPGVLEDLRLPLRPPLAYRADFRGWGDWLGLE
mgnify:CR=1 FL=1